MKRKRSLLTFSLLLLLSPVNAQQQQVELNETAARVNRHLETKYPDYKHERGETIQGSSNVTIEWWSVPNGKVKVQVVPYESSEKAREVLHGFLKFNRSKEQLKGIGDEAFGHGYGLTKVVFTKGRFIVYVTADIDPNPDRSQSLTAAELAEREKQETGRVTRDFAKNIASALGLP